MHAPLLRQQPSCSLQCMCCVYDNANHATAHFASQLRLVITLMFSSQCKLQDLVRQYQLLCELISRNTQLRQEALHCDDEAVIPLPFVLLQCGADAVMDVQLSRDEQSAVLDFGRCAVAMPYAADAQIPFMLSCTIIHRSVLTVAADFSAVVLYLADLCMAMHQYHL